MSVSFVLAPFYFLPCESMLTWKNAESRQLILRNNLYCIHVPHPSIIDFCSGRATGNETIILVMYLLASV